MSGSVQPSIRNQPAERDLTAPERFCADHDLIPELTPFGHRTFDPWVLLAEADEWLRDLPSTAATFTTNEPFDNPQPRNGWWAGAVKTGFLILGAWPQNRRSNTDTRWVNPYYEHERALAPGDFESREAQVRKCATLGAFRYADIAPRFGIGKSALESWIRYHDVPWAEWRREGRRRLARTVVTAAEWTGLSPKSVLTRLLLPYETLETWLGTYARQTDWEVPADPAMNGGFGP